MTKETIDLLTLDREEGMPYYEQHKEELGKVSQALVMFFRPLEVNMLIAGPKRTVFSSLLLGFGTGIIGIDNMPASVNGLPDDTLMNSPEILAIRNANLDAIFATTDEDTPAGEYLNDFFHKVEDSVLPFCLTYLTYEAGPVIGAVRLGYYLGRKYAESLPITPIPDVFVEAFEEGKT